MAHPITFKPQPVDFHKELMRRVDEAPREHAEALLVLWEMLQTSHDTGMLELAKGLMGGKDIIAGKLAEAANLPESVNAIRNGIALARILGELDPAMLQRLADGFGKAAQQQKQEKEPPSLWRLFRRSTSSDARRGLSYMTNVLTALGRATRE
ncbi:MAG: DUF1641 domain-containing protein [Acidobacteria bacterium]|nr:DUF1641 domain-containing protein [Acidobacteriota bacterium]